jgi:hypothetical protein
MSKTVQRLSSEEIENALTRRRDPYRVSSALDTLDLMAEQYPSGPPLKVKGRTRFNAVISKQQEREVRGVIYSFIGPLALHSLLLVFENKSNKTNELISMEVK